MWSKEHLAYLAQLLKPLCKTRCTRQQTWYLSKVLPDRSFWGPNFSQKRVIVANSRQNDVNALKCQKLHRNLHSMCKSLHSMCRVYTICVNQTNHYTKITHAHRFHASNVTWTRTVTLALGNFLIFSENLHSWQEFYTTAGRTGRAKYQLCAAGGGINFTVEKTRGAGWFSKKLNLTSS